jgi:hypothetical protein
MEKLEWDFFSERRKYITSSVPKKKADNVFSRYFMLKDELNFNTINFWEMARPYIRIFLPLLNGSKNEK